MCISQKNASHEQSWDLRNRLPAEAATVSATDEGATQGPSESQALPRVGLTCRHDFGSPSPISLPESFPYPVEKIKMNIIFTVWSKPLKPC